MSATRKKPSGTNKGWTPAGKAARSLALVAEEQARAWHKLAKQVKPMVRRLVQAHGALPGAKPPGKPPGKKPAAKAKAKGTWDGRDKAPKGLTGFKVWRGPRRD